MSRYRRTLSTTVLVALILAACQPVMPVDMISDDTESVVAHITQDVIFSIGQIDQSCAEFAEEGFDPNKEFICPIGADCTAEDIPASLYRGDGPLNNRETCAEAVPKLTVVFQLNKDYDDLLLHLARAGSETTSISVDGGEPIFVTSEMLGSRDGAVFGSCDLLLGPVQSGSHFITFSVHNDGNGDGKYAWDALSLSAP